MAIQLDASLEGSVRDLLQEVQKLKERVAHLDVTDIIDDFKEQLADLTTEVRLQARRSNTAASQLHLDLRQLTSSSLTASPRVAGPICSASPTPRIHSAAGIPTAGLSPRAASASQGLHSPQQTHREASTKLATAAAAATTAGGSQACAAGGAGSGRSGSRNGESSSGILNTLKQWKEDVLEPADQLLQTKQLAEHASTIATEAAATASRCQQQVLELKGRHGQAERRLDTLWQLQEAATQDQAAIARLQQDLQQTQQQLQQQQHNMAAMQAQIQHLIHTDDSRSNSIRQLQSDFINLQDQTDSLSDKVTHHQKGLSAQQAAVTAAEARLRNEVQEQMQHVQDQLLRQQQQLDKCSSEGQAALDKCEQLRQAAVVTSRRLDAVGAQIQDAVEPSLQRLSTLESTAAATSDIVAECTAAVQQHQLSTALAQLSAAAVRQQQEFKALLSGLADRVDLLETESARQEKVVSQEDFRRQLRKLRAEIESAAQQATSPLTAQLATKADTPQLNSQYSSLAARITSSEQQLLHGLKSVGDKTAALLQCKADLGTVEAWKQQVMDEFIRLKVDVAHTLHLPCDFASDASKMHFMKSPSASADDSRAACGSPGNLSQGTSSTEQQKQQCSVPQVADCAAACTIPQEPHEHPPAAATASTAVSPKDIKADSRASRPTAAQPPQTPTVSQPPSVAVQSTADGVAAMVLRPLTGAQAASGKNGGNSRDVNLRPASSVRPWASSPTPGVAEMHSAAQNAKLLKAARDKESVRNRVMNSRSVAAAMVHSTSPLNPEEVAAALKQQLSVVGLLPAANAADTAGDAGSSNSSAAGEAAGDAGVVVALEAAATADEQALCSSSADGAGKLASATSPVAVAPKAKSSLLKVSLRQQSASSGGVANPGSCSKAGTLSRSSSAVTPLICTPDKRAGDAVDSFIASSQQQQQPLRQGKLPAVPAPAPTADEIRALLRNRSAGSSRPGSAIAALHMPALS